MNYQELLSNTNPQVLLKVKNFGTIKLELFPSIAPITVKNFLKLVESGFYNGLTFHRIIEGFMIQGGDPLGNGTGGSKEKIKGEFAKNGIENPLLHSRGVISMARSMFPDSASSQFFIMHKDAPHLDGSYAAFGAVTEGIEVVDKIASVDVNYNDMPLVPVVIEKAEVI
ncbi:MAG: peptidylprolyl isomerase [Anaeroplasmataceae bacterium]|nr:peptidylprolyl isomerase [Anaeroplasmataceae bacterium]